MHVLPRIVAPGPREAVQVRELALLRAALSMNKIDVVRQGQHVLHVWGVVGKSGLLGGGWFEPILPWPMRFNTRHEAREAARVMEAKYFYLKTTNIWSFRVVRMRITVDFWS